MVTVTLLSHVGHQYILNYHLTLLPVGGGNALQRIMMRSKCVSQFCFPPTPHVPWHLFIKPMLSFVHVHVGGKDRIVALSVSLQGSSYIGGGPH